MHMVVCGRAVLIATSMLAIEYDPTALLVVG